MLFICRLQSKCICSMCPIMLCRLIELSFTAHVAVTRIIDQTSWLAGDQARIGGYITSRLLLSPRNSSGAMRIPLSSPIVKYTACLRGYRISKIEKRKEKNKPPVNTAEPKLSSSSSGLGTGSSPSHIKRNAGGVEGRPIVDYSIRGGVFDEYGDALLLF
ncbi:hypothetical protein LZ32DRAFT_406862 [Colletotrichum eremochloae]|nr:hypothetical protein LZ32DRAFT_406862 [Colletotrichum eremochloae]